MNDYGIKVSHKDKSVLSDDHSDILMSTQFPFAKIDPTMTDTFRTTSLIFLNNPPSNTKTEVYRFAHGYSYKPMVWGLWKINWGPNVLTTPNTEQNGYGYIINTTAFPSSYLSYEVDSTHVILYAYRGEFAPSLSSLIGTTATLTTYIFVDDLTEQDYS
jgi:hypothetical protein